MISPYMPMLIWQWHNIPKRILKGDAHLNIAVVKHVYMFVRMYVWMCHVYMCTGVFIKLVATSVFDVIGK